MLLEIRHLKSLLAIKHEGSFSLAAEQVHLTQSALSHQIKALENYYGTTLFLRNSKPLHLTTAGNKLVNLAQNILPLIRETEQELKNIAQGKTGRLHISIECHACFEWLLPVLEKFQDKWPSIEVDIKMGMAFDPLPALQTGSVDLVITSDPTELADVAFEPLFDYEARVLLPPKHEYARKKSIQAEDFKNQILITYPVNRQKLDVFTKFLHPANIEPLEVRQAEITSIIFLLVAGRRGISVLPDWVVNNAQYPHKLISKPLGKTGLQGTLFAAVRKSEHSLAYIDEFFHLAKKMANR